MLACPCPKQSRAMKTSMAVALLVLVLAHVGLSVRFSDVGSVVVHADVSSAAATCASDCRVGYAPARPPHLLLVEEHNAGAMLFTVQRQQDVCLCHPQHRAQRRVLASTQHRKRLWPTPNRHHVPHGRCTRVAAAARAFTAQSRPIPIRAGERLACTAGCGERGPRLCCPEPSV